MGSIYIV